MPLDSVRIEDCFYFALASRSGPVKFPRYFFVMIGYLRESLTELKEQRGAVPLQGDVCV